jgi:hypothetical protein
MRIIQSLNAKYGIVDGNHNAAASLLQLLPVGPLMPGLHIAETFGFEDMDRQTVTQFFCS